jgi:CheY-like chemotaxis protein
MAFKDAYLENMAKRYLSSSRNLAILLADDDVADRLLFQEALEELPIHSQLSSVNNGEALMKRLKKRGSRLPDVLFLDINMPRKNGFASLAEIKLNTRLQNLPVIIFSTASPEQMENIKINQVFNDAAHYYIRKPNNFSELKNVIYRVLKPIAEKTISLPSTKEKFILKGDSTLLPNEIKATVKNKTTRKTN